MSGLSKPELAELPHEYFSPCERPQHIQSGLTVGQLIETLSVDADKLNECADRHGNLAAAVQLRDSIQAQEANHD